MEAVVYILCALTSLTCAVLLSRGYRKRPSRLLFWAAVCFAGLTVNNILLFFDLIIFTHGPDLLLYRNATALGALGLFLYGLVWDVV